MEKKKAWVWFKRSISNGSWVSGFTARHEEDDIFLIESTDFVSCKVPKWRIKFEEPEDPKEPPNIPDNPIWKYF